MRYRIFGVRGFCMDAQNPDFNVLAKVFGRGIARKHMRPAPVWCRFWNEARL